MNRLLSKIKLKPEEIDQVQDAHEYLISILKGKALIGLLPSAQDFLLIGSFARDTKISPLDDVDVFYVIGQASNLGNSWHSISDCDFNFGENFIDIDQNISSIKILELIKKELSATYPRSEIRRDGEVVNLFLSSYGVGFDITPVFEIPHEDYFLMPQGGGLSKWKKSNPLIDHAHSIDLDEKHNFLFKDIILILKYWFERKRIRSLRSYHLESIAYHLFDFVPRSSYRIEDGLMYLLTNLNQNNHLYSCPDPTGLSENLSSGLTYLDIVNIQKEAQIALNVLSQGDDKFIEYVEG